MESQKTQQKNFELPYQIIYFNSHCEWKLSKDKEERDEREIVYVRERHVGKGSK